MARSRDSRRVATAVALGATWLGASAMVPAARAQVSIHATVTADNAYGFGFGTATTLSTYYGGVENCAASDIWAPETYDLTAPDTDFLYVVTWSDDAAQQGLLAQFQAGTATPVLTGDPRWEVFATGLDFDVTCANPTPGPTVAAIEAQIAIANAAAGDPATTSVTWVGAAGGLWVGEDNASTTVGCYWVLVPGIDPGARWMWYNSRHPATVPDAICSGANHREFLIFRLPVGEVPAPVCPLAEAGPDLEACPGEQVRLDAAPSSGCPAGYEYRWLDGAVEVCGWSSATACLVTPAALPTRYTLEVACAGQQASCTVSDAMTVGPAPAAVAEAGLDHAVCEFVRLVLDGAGSSPGNCPAGLLYEWRRGAVVVRPWDPSPLWVPPTSPPGLSVYTLAVTCAPGGGCESVDDLGVDVRSCPLAVVFAGLEARPDGERVRVRFRTLLEEGTSFFRLERGAEPAGPFRPVGEPVEATGAGTDYTLLDPGPDEATPWYRVVEHGDAGRGDVSAPVRVGAGDGAGDGDGPARAPGAGGGRSRGSRPR